LSSSLLPYSGRRGEEVERGEEGGRERGEEVERGEEEGKERGKEEEEGRATGGRKAVVGWRRTRMATRARRAVVESPLDDAIDICWRWGLERVGAAAGRILSLAGGGNVARLACIVYDMGRRGGELECVVEEYYWWEMAHSLQGQARSCFG